MTLQEAITKINGNIFLREFTFSRNRFQPDPGRELELADSIVCVGTRMVIFQLKERHSRPGGGNTRAWFSSKVLKKGTKQIRDTLRYLTDYAPITITNERGTPVSISQTTDYDIAKIVCYDGAYESGLDRFHISRTAGFIHLLALDDYLSVVDILFTPPEIAEYLQFREQLFHTWAETSTIPHEAALLGQYLSGEMDQAPSEKYLKYLTELTDDRLSYDISHILGRLADHLDPQPDQPQTQHYRILAEFANLMRTDLKLLKDRIYLCLKKARENELFWPTRFVVQRTGCGFLVLPLTHNHLKDRQEALIALANLAKYDQKCERQVGMSIVCDGADVLIDWIFIEGPHVHNPQTEDYLREQSPFQPLRDSRVPRYRFEKH